MKNKKWFVIVGIVILLIAAFAFGVFKLTQNIKKDKEITRQNIEKVTKYYDEFNDLATVFNEKSQTLTLQISQTYFTNLQEESTNLQKILNELNEIINNMNLISKELNHLCKATYLDATINRSCSSYSLSFESAEKAYTEEIQNYNDLVTKYNDWTKENPEYDSLSLYERNEVKYEEK